MRFITRADLRAMTHHRGHQGHGLHRGHLRHVGLDTPQKKSVARDLGEGLTGLALGAVQGRMGGMPEYQGIPLDFAVAVLAKLVQYAPFHKPAYVEAAAETIGRGSFVVFTTAVGQYLGQKWRAKSVGLSGQPATNRNITQGPTHFDAPSFGAYRPEVLRASIAAARRH
jgi:hypothetical protein